MQWIFVVFLINLAIATRVQSQVLLSKSYSPSPIPTVTPTPTPSVTVASDVPTPSVTVASDVPSLPLVSDTPSIPQMSDSPSLATPTPTPSVTKASLSPSVAPTTSASIEDVSSAPSAAPIQIVGGTPAPVPPVTVTTPAPVTKPVPAPIPVPVPAPLPVPVPVPKPVKAPTKAPAPAPRRRRCFSSMTTVEEKEQGIIPIAQLKIGDFVRTGTGNYSQVYGFGHLNHDHPEPFVQIHFEDSESSNNNRSILEMSADHLIFVERNDQSYPIKAIDVVVGDMISGRNVVALSDVTRNGMYAPLTMSGEIAVNGVRASNYIDVLHNKGWFDQHVVVHAAYLPRRLYCNYFMDSCMQETYDTDGFNAYTKFLVDCTSILNDIGWVVTVAVSAGCVVLVHFSRLIELQPFVFGFVGVIVAVHMILRRKIRKL